MVRNRIAQFCMQISAYWVLEIVYAESGRDLIILELLMKQLTEYFLLLLLIIT